MAWRLPWFSSRPASTGLHQYRRLIPERIEGETAILARRIRERFPGSGIERVARELLDIARESSERARMIARPIRSLRAGIVILIALIVVGIVGSFLAVDVPPPARLTLFQFIQVLEAGINDVVLIGAGIFFLVTIERKVKRHRALTALHELRSIAHVIDMHQLNKDPEYLRMGRARTPSSPKLELSLFEITRYLDYCSEMLALTGKIAALYVQNFDDEVALAAVNEVESLTTGLSRKIWQKLMILSQMESTTPARGKKKAGSRRRAPRTR